MMQKKTLFILSTASIAFACSVGVYAYVFAQVKAKNEEVSSISNEMYFAEQNRQTEETIRRLVRTTHEEQARLGEAFVSDDGVPQFLEALETVGTDTGLSVETQTVSVDSKNKVLAVELKAKGSFGLLFQYLELLEAVPYHLAVERVSMIRSTLSDEERTQLGSASVPWEAVFRIELRSFEM